MKMTTVLYVGMLYDITSLLNLEPCVETIYVIDMVDLSYGSFVENEENSWITLKQRIKKILTDGYDKNVKIKNGKSVITYENDIVSDNNIINYYLNESHKWTIKFHFESDSKTEVSLIFYAGYSSENVWPSDIKNISSIMSIGSYFYCKIGCDPSDGYDENTHEMIKERCCLPFTFYTTVSIYDTPTKEYELVSLNDILIKKLVIYNFSNESLNLLLKK